MDPLGAPPPQSNPAPSDAPGRAADRVEALFHAAYELPPPERADYVRRACAGDAALADHVLAMLARAAQDTPSYLRPQVTATAAAAARDPEQLGRYRIVERIGEGGMGVVYLAEQTEPVHRRVALKVMRAGLDTEAALARFAAERQALALMDHPHIARIFDAGATEQGRPYYVLEYTPGPPLHAWCESQQLDTDARLILFVQVCDAVQHAHQRGVIHRDLKPSNVLVTTVSGAPMSKVIDFGIARPTVPGHRADAAHTRADEVIGTFDYMSPEQASGGSDVDTRADIWSLGVMLYELLTRQLPFAEEALPTRSLTDVRRILSEQEPPRPSTRVAQATVAGARVAEHTALARRLRGDLDWIVLRALAKDRERRYASASELAADVRRHLRGEPVLARPPSARYRVAKFVRRHRAPVLAAGLVLAALAAGLVGTTAGLRRARAEQTLADARTSALRRQLYATNVALAHEALQRGDAGASQRLLGECPADLRGFEWHWLRYASQRAAHRVLLPAGEAGLCAVVHGDGRRVLVGTSAGRVLVADPEQGSIVSAHLVAGERLSTLAADRAGHVVIAGSDDGAWLHLDGADLRQVGVLAAPTEQVRHVAISPDGELVALLRSDQSCELLRLREGTRRRLAPPPSPVDFTLLAFSPDGRLLAAGGRDLAVFDVERGTACAIVPEPRRLARDDEPPQFLTRVTALAFDGSGGRVAVGLGRPVRAPAGPGNSVEIRAARTLALEDRAPARGTGALTSLCFADADRALVLGGASDLAVIHQTLDRAAWNALGHELPIVAVVQRPSDGALVSVSASELCLWPVSLPPCPDVRPVPLPFGRSVWSPRRTRVATPIWTLGGALVLDTQSFDVVRALVVPKWPSRVFAITPDDARAVATGGEETVVVDLDTGATVLRLARSARLVLGQVSHDGTSFVAADADGRVAQWDLASGTRTHELAEPGAVAALVPLRDGAVGVLRTAGALEIVDASAAATRRPSRTLPAPAHAAVAMIHPDGRHVVVVDGDGRALVLSLADGTTRVLVPGGALDVDVSPDGARLACVSAQGIELRDFAAGTLLLSQLVGSHGTQAVRFMPDGRGLLACGSQLVAWDLDAEPARASARAASRRGYSAWLALKQRHIVAAHMRQHADAENLDAPVHAAVLRLLDRVGDCPFELNQDAWSRVVRPNLPLDEYRHAVVAAQTAFEQMPIAAVHNTLATAYLRAGEFARAASAAHDLVRAARAAGQPPSTFDLAVLCMAQARLGERDTAARTLDELSAAMQDPARISDPQVWLLVREAEATLAER